jgi:type II secretory ATPase GspE/PulE/Tfp pilus assembly ATPase PilB-like protein
MINVVCVCVCVCVCEGSEHYRVEHCAIRVSALPSSTDESLMTRIINSTHLVHYTRSLHYSQCSHLLVRTLYNFSLY